MKSAVKTPHAVDPQNEDNAEDSEEDYMSMILPAPSSLPKIKETSIQRRQRLRREAEERGRTKPKAEREAEEKAAREKALRTSLITSSNTPGTHNGGKDEAISDEELKRNKGLAMMAKMGFKPGMVLGKEGGEGGRSEPIGVEIKEGRGGVGIDSERKRKFREQVEFEVKRVKEDEEEYRDRIRRERENARLEGLVGGAMRIAEKFDGEREDEQRVAVEGEEEGNSSFRAGDGKRDRTLRRTRPLKKINILYRALIRQREEKEHAKRMRNDFQQSLSSLSNYNDPDLDTDDRKALHPSTSSISTSASKQLQASLIQEEELEEDDEELEEFMSLEPGERLARLAEYLRREFRYCFWCKFRYEDEGMEGCPGITEEEHD